MVAHSSHFCFMIRAKIQINQNKIFYSWWSVLTQAKWEQSKDKFKYHLQTDNEFLFHAITRALLQKVGSPITEGELLVSLEQTDAPAPGREFPKLLWDEMSEGIKERVKLRLAFSYFWGLFSHWNVSREKAPYLLLRLHLWCFTSFQKKPSIFSNEIWQ